MLIVDGDEPPAIKRLLITGSTLRPQSDLNKMKIANELAEKVWPLIDRGEVKPVMDSTYRMEEVVDAHIRLETSQHIGKITLEVLEEDRRGVI